MLIWLILSLLVPATMVLCGAWMFKFPPEDINHWFGYRTARSMKNTLTWNFAQQYCGKLWLKWGCVLTIFTIFAVLFYGQQPHSEDAWGIAIVVLTLVQTLFLVLAIAPVERALKENFDDDGNPRTV